MRLGPGCQAFRVGRQRMIAWIDRFPIEGTRISSPFGNWRMMFAFGSPSLGAHDRTPLAAASKQRQTDGFGHRRVDEKRLLPGPSTDTNPASAGCESSE